jgi:hypothetical protein
MPLQANEHDTPLSVMVAPLPPTSVALLGGDPGIGKSTLLLQALSRLSSSCTALYVSGEESAQQVALRSRRLGLESGSLKVLAEIQLEKILAALLAQTPHVAVIDSIQTVYSEALQSAPGSVAQVRECAAQLTRPRGTPPSSPASMSATPLGKRRIAGMALGMLGMALLLGDDIRHFQRAPTAALMILGAAIAWAFGTVLLRKWQLPLPQNTLSGWMMLLGWIPIAILAPFFAPGPLTMPSPRAWFALLYNIFLAGTLAHWAWFTLARTLPVALSSMASLPVPIVGVFAGMLVLGERPGPSEWIALALVVAAMVAVLWAPKPVPAPMTPDD